ncbi:MAG: hypothetical protein GF350_16655, partial [Chitinivibrionales bacterium]|nr:hypothetical protein [Chitinivibrionales bacterium]
MKKNPGWFACLCAVSFSVPVWASPSVPGDITAYSTIYSIGIEWDIEGDTNHNASCPVQYRKAGETGWKDFVGLFRVDFYGSYNSQPADRAYNMLAGSILFLEPGTSFEVKLDLTDPDGGSESRTVTIATRRIPSMPQGGREIHVEPGSSGGSGTESDPYHGLDEAESAANPGDIILVHAGAYDEYHFNKSGTESDYLVWKAAGDGDAIFNQVRVYGEHTWFEGLKFEYTSPDDGRGLIGQNDVEDVVVSRCTFSGFNYSITLKSGCAHWYIADNTIAGDKVDFQVEGDFGGEGVELGKTSGHTVCYNSISLTADGVSYAHRNCDIFGNDIFNVSDDGIEPDYGYANIRMWGNRITNAFNHDFSFQPMYCGPWYLIRNQTCGTTQRVFKYRIQDRFLCAHNTFIGMSRLATYGHHILSSLSRNNLWILAGDNGYIWEGLTCSDPAFCISPDRFEPDWRTDVDYDGFDWGQSTYAFKWWENTTRYTDLESFVADVGIERHGIVVDKEDIFDSYSMPSQGHIVERRHFALRPGCNAVDAGDVLPGINENYTGAAPDLGALEQGASLPYYGP